MGRRRSIQFAFGHLWRLCFMDIPRGPWADAVSTSGVGWTEMVSCSPWWFYSVKAFELRFAKPAWSDIALYHISPIPVRLPQVLPAYSPHQPGGWPRTGEKGGHPVRGLLVVARGSCKRWRKWSLPLPGTTANWLPFGVSSSAHPLASRPLFPGAFPSSASRWAVLAPLKLAFPCGTAGDSLGGSANPCSCFGEESPPLSMPPGPGRGGDPGCLKEGSFCSGRHGVRGWHRDD